MTDDPIDFSPLDPARDTAAWAARVQTIVAEAQRRRAARSWESDLGRWFWPALGLAASISLISWVGPALFLPETTSASSTASADPTLLLLGWAQSGEVPSTAELLVSLRTSHDDQ